MTEEGKIGIGTEDELDTIINTSLAKDGDVDAAREILKQFSWAVQNEKSVNGRLLIYLAKCFDKIVANGEKADHALNLVGRPNRPLKKSGIQVRLQINCYVRRCTSEGIRTNQAYIRAMKEFDLSKTMIMKYCREGQLLFDEMNRRQTKVSDGELDKLRKGGEDTSCDSDELLVWFNPEELPQELAFLKERFVREGKKNNK